jgi:hypothetical protein
MLAYEFAEPENTEYAACVDLYRAAPKDVRVAHAIEAFDVGTPSCLSCRGIEPVMIFRGVESASTADSANRTAGTSDLPCPSRRS